MTGKLFSILNDKWLQSLVRYSIYDKLKRERKKYKDNRYQTKVIDFMSNGPIAVDPEEANRQYYEVSTDFLKMILGDHLKYSSAYYENFDEDFDKKDELSGEDIKNRLSLAEEAMLKLTCDRAQLKNGQQILDLGCGLGSLSFFIAKNYEKSNVLAVTNSATQKSYIEKKIKKEKLKNLKVIKKDINDFSTTKKFDRIISIEMFEDMRNYKLLLNRISKWLKNHRSRLFVHIFVHRSYTYFFSDNEWFKADLMAQHFFVGGLMPCFDIFSFFREDLEAEKTWEVNGKNYAKTASDWLALHRKNKDEIILLFQKQLKQKRKAKKMWFHWKLFFLACRDLFNYNDGREWFVGHYLLKKRKRKS